MKLLLLLVIVLFIAAVVYVLQMPPRAITLKDLHPADLPVSNTSARDTPEKRDTVALHDIVKKIEEKAVGNFYIIVESYTNLKLARQKAEKLKKILNRDIIVLPPTPEGYCRISYGQYSTLEEAKTVLKNERSKLGSDAWIYSVKK